MRRLGSYFVFLGCVCYSSTAAAQFDSLTGLASAFSDLGMAWGPLLPTHKDVRPERDPSARWLHWYGAEFLFEIGSAVPVKRRGVDYKANCIVVNDKATERRITTAAGRTDTTIVFAVTTKCPNKPNRLWQLEFGVGYSETSRFVIRSTDGDIAGLVREIPSISVYANYLKAGPCEDPSAIQRLTYCWDQYFGLHTGVTALIDPSLKTPAVTTEFSGGSPKSVQVGAVYGLANDVFPALTIFSEAGYVYRPFPRITWTQANVVAPTTARTRLDLSGWMLSLGVQLRVKDPKKG